MLSGLGRSSRHKKKEETIGADCGCGGECGFCASLAAKMARIHGDVILGAVGQAGIKPTVATKKEKSKGKGKKKSQ